MTAPLLALSLSNTLLKVGALAAFAGLVGIAILSLLVFSQARELKRLREWAGRAPERAAELEQRVSAEAAARAQRALQPRVGSPVPRATPVVSRAPAQAAAAGQPPGAVAPGAAPAPPAVVSPGGPAVPVTAAAGQAPAGQPPSTPAAAPLPGQPAFVPTGQSTLPAGTQQVPGVAQQRPTESAPGGESEGTADAPRPVGSQGVPATPAVVGAAPEPTRAESESESAGARPADSDVPAPAERTGELAPAAAAVVSAERVANGASAIAEGAQSPAPAGVAGVSTPATVAARAALPAAPVPTPPAPVPAAPVPISPTPVPARRAPATPRSPTPPSSVGPAAPVPPRPAASHAGRGIPGQPTGGGGGVRPVGGRAPGPPFLQEERSPRRSTALIVGGVVLGVAILAGVLLSQGGGSHQNQGTGTAATRVTSSGRHTGGAHRAHGAAAVASPAETHVVVLNSTETNGLAHHLSASLQQSGYTQSAALDGHPPTRATSVVEYAGGHRTEAVRVGQTLGIAQVQPLESAVASLVGSATVVVIAGEDQAATSGGEAASGAGTAGAGEPSANAAGQGAGEPAAGGEAADGAG